MKRKVVTAIVLLTMLLTACSNQEKNRNEPVVKTEQMTGELNNQVLSYIGITYRDFLENGGLDAEHYHGGRYIASLADLNMEFIFVANYDEKKADFVLSQGDKCIRVQGNIGDMIIGIQGMSSVEELLESLGNVYTISYTYEKGEPTAYYISERFLRISCDVNKDEIVDITLDISLNDADIISPETYCWIMLSETSNVLALADLR